MILSRHGCGLEQVCCGSSAVAHIPGPTTATLAAPAAFSAVHASTPLRGEDCVESLRFTSLRTCFRGPCGGGVECRSFRANVLHSELVSTRQRQNRRLVPATAAVCGSPATCRRRHTRCIHRTHVLSAAEPDYQSPRAPLEVRMRGVGSAGQDHGPRCPVTPRLPTCLTLQHRIKTALSNVMVGGVVSVGKPVRGTVVTQRGFQVRQQVKLTVLGQSWDGQRCGRSGQRRSRTASVVPVIAALVVVLSAFLVLPTATSDTTAQAVPSFTFRTISDGGCVYGYQVRAVDVTGDGFVDVLTGTTGPLCVSVAACRPISDLLCCRFFCSLLWILCRTEHSDPVPVRWR